MVIASNLAKLSAYLHQQGFKTEEHPHSVNAQAPGSELRIQFTTDARYQAFLARSIEAVVLGVSVRESLVWKTSPRASSGPTLTHADASANARRTNWTFIRLAEAYPELRSMYSELQEQLDRG